MVDDPKDPRNRAARISAAYDKAAQGRAEPSPQQPRQDREGSDMVRRSAPGMHLKPNGPMRQQVDSKVYNENLARERDAEAKKQADSIKARQPNQSADKSRER